MNVARVKKVLIALGLFLIVIQIFQPRRTNPPVEPPKTLPVHVPISQDAYAALLRSCGDCHSNRTRWPWYSHVAPISWVVVDDVNEGRRHMNFDDWEAPDTPKPASERVSEICEELRKNGMPPFSYRMVHNDLLLKPQELDSICTWSQGFPAPVGGTYGQK